MSQRVTVSRLVRAGEPNNASGRDVHAGEHYSRRPEMPRQPELPPEYQDAALAYAANLLRTLSAGAQDFADENALRFSARKLDEAREPLPEGGSDA